jgi:hypothetical protein
VRRGGGPGARPREKYAVAGKSGTGAGKDGAGAANRTAWSGDGTGKSLLGKDKYDPAKRKATKQGHSAGAGDAAGGDADADARPAKRTRTDRDTAPHSAPAPAPPRERRGRDGKLRVAPGAALALAKRESTAIVPSAGTRIKF